jgi:Zinc knuckle
LRPVHSEEKKAQLIANNQCFLCEQQGHRSNNCPKKNEFRSNPNPNPNRSNRSNWRQPAKAAFANEDDSEEEPEESRGVRGIFQKTSHLRGVWGKEEC